uniref:Secreted protein n=1 Tax=Ixodes ricinus TaxID=34613 RepID=V5H5R0_IXORI
MHVALVCLCFCTNRLPTSSIKLRDSKYEGETRITIVFYIDDFVDATEQQVKDLFAQPFIFTTTEDLQSYFVVDDIHLPYWIKYIGTEPGLRAALEGNKNTDYIYLDGAVDALTAHFIDQNPPDIICLVTNYTIHNGDNIRKAYGYSKDHTLCKSVVSMLLAYAPDTAGYAGRMLSEMIRASVNPQEVPNLYH